MSGIVGLIKSNNEPINLSLLHQMTDFMAFRGPDAQAVWHKNKVGLGHTLLRTTFEQEHEQQPFTLDHQVWIVADARLDGRKDLLAALQAKGREIAEDAPDIELVLHTYLIWDIACVDHLMGDFVFIIWDERQQRLFCGRDQFGILPFYYAQVNNTLICSNTLNTIRLHPQISAKLNEQAVGDHLLFGMNMEFNTTTFADIQRLPPAHTLIWSDGKVRVQRYWQLQRCLPLIRYKRPEEYVEHFYELFEQAISDRVRTDKLSTHLSGGMDSTSIATIAQKVLAARGKPFDFQAFTLSSEQEQQEDSYAGLVAKEIGIPHNFVATDGYVRAVPSTQRRMCLPEPCLSIPERDPFQELTKLCAAHGRVVLTGFGGDPALYFGEFYWLEWLKHGLIGQWLAVQLHYVSLYRRRPTFYFRQGWRYWQKIAQSISPSPTWINPAFVKRMDLEARWEKIYADSLDQISRYGMGNSPYWSNLFAWADPGYSSIQLKHYFPFFDLRLVNYLIAIPPVPWLVKKTILREAMQERLPEAVRNRPKKVFDNPQDYSKVMQEMAGGWISNLLSETPILAEYVDNYDLLALLEKPEDITTGNRFLIERTLAFAYWLRTQKTENISAHKNTLLI
ncbi:asparagine synthetase B family protein [Nostoc sp. UHCC 0251]|uniref:asparagine synthetase B family protein n=1 Tax=Nostoc sp. UHCC 0251 TaxID=3110240 RepID=UPI002B1EDF53|nr:asparagine synthase-related protein [Nostoc sp. UHCC 0251]MEA5622973.1 asparagine synthase-related protein [Nostoc sp. UHCC 0251]